MIHSWLDALRRRTGGSVGTRGQQQHAVLSLLSHAAAAAASPGLNQRLFHRRVSTSVFWAKERKEVRKKNEKPSYLNDCKTSEVRPPLLTLTSWPWLSRSHVLKGTRTRRPHAKGRTKAWLEVLETGLCALWQNKGAITRPDCLPNTHFLESREFSLFRWVHWNGRDCLKTLATQILCIALNLWKDE